MSAEAGEDEDDYEKALSSSLLGTHLVNNTVMSASVLAGIS